MRRPRDSQREAVYAWEQRVGCWVFKPARPMTIDEVRALVERLWVGYMGTRKGMPITTDGRGRRCAGYNPDHNEVRFPRWTRQPGMVAHEVAHAIIEQRCGRRRLAWHGPEFVRVYAELLVAFLGFAPKALEHELTTGKRRVRMAGVGDLPWRQKALARAA